ncbi:MAG: sodium:solute symporter, partial [Myxococcota bacterium]
MFDLHPIGVAIALYLVGMIAIAWWAKGRVESVEDFVLAGRTLGLRIITSSLLATWVGAGTLLVAADEIHRVGLSVIALDPIGSGAALLVGA